MARANSKHTTVSRRALLAAGAMAAPVAMAVAATIPDPDAPLVALAAQHEATLARVSRRGNDEATLERLSEHLTDLERAIADHPAAGIAGVLVKLRLSVWMITEFGDPDGVELGCCESSIATLERLQGRAA